MTSLLILGQVILALYFIMSGINHFMKKDMMVQYSKSKGMGGGAPALVMLSGILLVLAGVGLLLGVYVLWSLWALIAFLLLVSFIMHAFWKQEDPQAKMQDMTHFRANIALAAALLILTALVSNWPWALAL